MSTDFFNFFTDPDNCIVILLSFGFIIGWIFSNLSEFLSKLANCLRYLAKYIKRKYEQSKEN